MEESAEEALKREETLRIYHSTKEALKIIGDVARDTITEPIPPPIKQYEFNNTMSVPTIK
jgi:dynamin GTPase